jgi:endonuclease G
MSSKSKSDQEQLKGILEQFSPEVIAEVLQGYGGQEAPTTDDTGGVPIQKHYSDFADPGIAVTAGAEAAVRQLTEVVEIERIVGPANFLPVHFLEEGAILQRAVARVVMKSGAAWASGFMVSPNLFLTNNHVIPTAAFAATVEAQFMFQFNLDGSAAAIDTFQFNAASVFRTNAALDYTLIRMQPKLRLVFRASESMLDEAVMDDEADLPVLPVKPGLIKPIVIRWERPGNKYGIVRLPTSSTYAVGQHLNIIQHPAGRRKEVALQDNTITGVFPNVLRYTTDTEGGSSGSPVFNNAWDLVSLHHAGGDFVGGAWLNNEGIRIDRIVADLRAHFGAGHAVLTELGI